MIWMTKERLKRIGVSYLLKSLVGFFLGRGKVQIFIRVVNVGN